MSPRWLHWPAAVSAEDWDTHADGVYKYLAGFLVEPVSYSGSTGLSQFARKDDLYGFRYSSTALAANAAPFMALWNDTTGVWVNYYAKVLVDWFGTLNGALYVTPLADFPTDESLFLIPLSTEPTNIGGWRDYDGPTE